MTVNPSILKERINAFTLIKDMYFDQTCFTMGIYNFGKMSNHPVSYFV